MQRRAHHKRTLLSTTALLELPYLDSRSRASHLPVDGAVIDINGPTGARPTPGIPDDLFR